jgi:hypothetical protein
MDALSEIMTLLDIINVGRGGSGSSWVNLILSIGIETQRHSKGKL